MFCCVHNVPITQSLGLPLPTDMGNNYLSFLSVYAKKKVNDKKNSDEIELCHHQMHYTLSADKQRQNWFRIKISLTTCT
jgi:hypothetical protein